MTNPIKVKINTIHDIEPEKRFLIDELIITGKFELKYDLPILKAMCNTIVDGKRTGGNLSIVDLSESHIAERFSDDSIYNEFQWVNMKDCIFLKKISLPSKIICHSSTGDSFSGCKSLESISIVGSDLPMYYEANGRGYDIDGVLFHEKGRQRTLVKFPANKGKEYIIPNNVTKIGAYAFEDSHLSKLIMPIVPPSCPESAFKGVDMTALTLMVPKKAHDFYWVDSVFGKLKIEDMDE